MPSIDAERDPIRPPRPRLDGAAVFAIATVAAIANVVQHEATHALACPLVGAELKALSALCVGCAAPDSAAGRVVAGAAPAVDLVLAAALWAWLRRGGPRSGPARLLTYLVMLMSALAGSGYFMVSGIAGIGDVAVLLEGASPAWAWRAAATVFGAALFLGTVGAALRVLGRVLGGAADDAPARVRDAQRVGFTAYAAAVDDFPKPVAPALAVDRDARWWAAAVVALVLFVGVLGRTLTFG